MWQRVGFDGVGSLLLCVMFMVPISFACLDGIMNLSRKDFVISEVFCVVFGYVRRY